MSNDQAIKVGQKVTYNIGGRTLTLKPLPLGRMKKATLVFTETDQNNFDLIGRYLIALLDNGLNDGVTLDWVQDNITIPEAQEMVDASRAINGLESFFQKGAAPKPVAVTERPLEEIAPIPSV